MDLLDRDSLAQRLHPWLLHFLNADLEEGYIDYLHPRSLVLVPILHTVVAVTQLVLLALSGELLILTVYMPFASVLSWAIYLSYKYRKANPRRLLMLERGLLTLTAVVSIVGDITNTTRVYAERCPGSSTSRLDSRKAYRQPQCERFWSPFVPGVLAIMVSMRILRHPFLLLAASCGVSCQLIASLAYDVPDKLHQLYLVSVFLAVSFAFVCFVQRQLELEQRNHFLEFRFVVEARQRLQYKNEELLRLSENLVPATILARLQSHDPMLPRDMANDAVVLVAGVYKFGVWCTKHRPIDAAVRVGTAHDLFRKLCRRKELDVIGGFGDTIAAVGNLIQPLEVPAMRACTVADSLRVEPALGGEEEFPLCQVVDGGRLEGGFVGTKFVRYDVFGEPYDAARATVHDCLPGEILASPYVRARLSEDSWTEEGGARRHVDDFDAESSFARLNLTDDDRQRFRAAAGSQSSNASNSANDMIANRVQSLFLSIQDPTNPSHTAQQSLTSGAVDNNDDDMSSHRNVNPLQGLIMTAAGLQAKKKKTKAEELEERYQALTTTRTAWCCFKEFADSEVEAEYHRMRIGNLRHAASLAWFAYAVWVGCVFCILMVDLETHRFPLGAILLIVAVLLSLVMAVVPRVLASEAMERWFFVWSVTGIWLPLLTVFGCALSRPAAVGNDVRLYMLLGAIVRVHCFTSSRWQVVIVPITIAVGATSYLLPGAYLRSTWPIMLVVIGVTVAADWSRDQSMREALRRRVEAQLVNNRLDSTTRLLEGLHRGLLPAPAFELIYAHKKEAEAMSQMFIPGMVNTKPVDSDPGQFEVFEDSDACVAIIRFGTKAEAAPALMNDSISSEAMSVHSQTSSSTPQHSYISGTSSIGIGRAVSVSDVVAPFDALEAAVAASKFISIASIVGDQAVLVGPVRMDIVGAHTQALSTEAAFGDIFALCTKLTLGVAANGIHFGAIIDVDSVAHIVRSGDVASYSLLGVATTRLAAVADGLGVSGMAGTLLTDRAVKVAERHGMLNGLEVRPNGPVKVRGAGVVRLLKVSASLPSADSKKEKRRSHSSVDVDGNGSVASSM